MKENGTNLFLATSIQDKALPWYAAFPRHGLCEITPELSAACRQREKWKVRHSNFSRELRTIPKPMDDRNSITAVEDIERLIFFIRGHKVMLDCDLAELYGVETKALNRAFTRNRERFPGDFVFQLTDEEFDNLRYQIGTSRWGGRRYLPYAFTEQGVAMLSGVLHSKRAVRVNVEIMRTFVRLRQLLASNAQLARKLDALEKKYDGQFKVVFDAIRQLMTPPEPKKRKIGFIVKERAEKYKLKSTRP